MVHSSRDGVASSPSDAAPFGALPTHNLHPSRADAPQQLSGVHSLLPALLAPAATSCGSAAPSVVVVPAGVQVVSPNQHSASAQSTQSTAGGAPLHDEPATPRASATPRDAFAREAATRKQQAAAAAATSPAAFSSAAAASGTRECGLWAVPATPAACRCKRPALSTPFASPCSPMLPSPKRSKVAVDDSFLGPHLLVRTMSAVKLQLQALEVEALTPSAAAAVLSPLVPVLFCQAACSLASAASACATPRSGRLHRLF